MNSHPASTETSPAVAEFLRQVTALTPDSADPIDLTSLWTAAGSPPDGRPDRWRTACLEAGSIDSPGTWSVVDGRAFASGMIAFDYLIRLDIDLKYQATAFRTVMRHGLDVFLPFAVDPTPAKAAVVIGIIMGNREGYGLAEAVGAVRRGIEFYAEQSTEPAWDVETACARMTRALRNEPFPKREDN